MVRKYYVVYKGVTIEAYIGSNYVYVNNRPFTSLLSCKRWITKYESVGLLESVIAKQREVSVLVLKRGV